ncbi:MAG: hypothetical protein EPGJADBJ_00164 [Saprospiraceae bacterium]|nr:hypothetical protein [Saprospiraceae bacterium]
MKNASFRRISALLALCLSLSSIYAQVRIGIAGGVNLAKMNFNGFALGSDAIVTSTSETGLRLALPVEISFGPHFAIQPEVLYGQQGTYVVSRREEQFGGWTYRDRVSGTIHYESLEIPLLAKFRLGAGKFKVHFMAGPSIALALSGESTFSEHYQVFDYYNYLVHNASYQGVSNLVFTSDGYDDDFGSQMPFSQIAYNAHVGGGLEYNFGHFGLFLDARYVVGLNDLLPDALNAEEKWSGKQRTIGLGLGAFVSLNGQ